MSLSLVRSFGVVSWQGMPAFGRLRFGVPAGGAFDIESFRLACGLAGADGAWELGMAQGVFRAERPGVVGVAGAVATVVYRDERFETGSAFSILPGEEFTVEAPSVGARVYVAFGLDQRPFGWRRQMEGLPSSVFERGWVRVVAGPQADSFDLSLLGHGFTASRVGNRVGVRLEPGLGAHAMQLPSEPQCVGTVQVSNDGTLIVIGPDGPTIGGYPKIAVVATCDIGRIGQLQPGDALSFRIASVEEVRALGRESATRLEKRIRTMRLAWA